MKKIQMLNSNQAQLYKLVLAMIFSFPIVPTVILVGSFVGKKLSSNPSLATLPIAVVIVGTVLGIIPANLISKKIGRKLAFLVGAIYAQIACLIAVFAIYQEVFLLFNIAVFMLGNSVSFVHQYRFAAVELMPSSKSASAISSILVGGILGGVLGPYLANLNNDLLAVEYAGSFISLAGLNFITFLILLSYKHKQYNEPKQTIVKTERNLTQIITQPKFIIAVLVSAFGYGLMSLLMTAVPLSMKHSYNFDLSTITFVVQSHIFAMYIPSLFSGFVLKKIGVFNFVILGFVFNLASYIVGQTNQQIIGFWLSLFLLGIGWNFLFIGGTYLVTKTYHPNEKFKTQALNDFLVFGIQAIAALSSGLILYFFSWSILNKTAMGILFFVLIIFLVNKMFEIKKSKVT